MDPQNPHHLFASFWGDEHLPDDQRRRDVAPAPWATCRPATSSRAAPASRSASRNPPAAASPTLYTGFDYFDLATPTTTARVYKSTDDGAHWTATATGSRHQLDPRLLRHAVLLRQRGEARPDEPERRLRPRLLRLQLQPAVRRHLPLHRRWRDLEEPRLRPAPGLPRVRVRARATAQHIAIGNDGGVWQSHTGGGRNGAGDPLSAADWENLNGTGRPEHRGAGPLDRPGHHPVHLDADRAARPRPVLGRHAGQRHAAQVARQQPLVRPGQR